MHEFYFLKFSVDRGINKKRTENCINEHSALLQKFSILFSVDTSINLKNITFISYHLILFHFNKESIILTLINAGFFPTFDVIEIHMRSQYSFSINAMINKFF